MENGKRPTILDVATAAGVGASTVSRYVRGAKSVSPGVAESIAAVIARLGYEPNVLARGLRVGRTRTVGVLVPHVSNVFYATALRAIEAEAHRHDFTVLLLTHHEDQALQQAQLNTLKQFQCHGIILIAAANTDPAAVSDLVGDTPLVALDRPLGKLWDSVTLHNAKAAEAATEHLLEHGYRHIVAITAPHRLETLRLRARGYQDALEKAGVQPSTIVYREPAQLQAALAQELRHGASKKTALLSLSYSLTVALLHALRANGHALRDVGLVCIDDLEFATLLDPPLTSLCQPAERLAQLAVTRLFKRMNGDTAARSHARLQGELIIRGSCGCHTQPGQDAMPRPLPANLRQEPALAAQPG